MSIFGSVQPLSESKFQNLYIIRFQTGSTVTSCFAGCVLNGQTCKIIIIVLTSELQMSSTSCDTFYVLTGRSSCQFSFDINWARVVEGVLTIGLFEIFASPSISSQYNYVEICVRYGNY